MAGSKESVREAASGILRIPAKRRQNPVSKRNYQAAMPLYSLLMRIPRPLYIVTALTLYLLLLWMGGHQSTVDHLPGRADFSKVYHLVFYSGWCCLAWLSMRRPGIALAVALTVLAGTGDELHQYFLPFREARVTDVLIDGCAALAGAWWMHAMRRRAMAVEKVRV
jgi:VanZ family protein